MDLLKCKIFYLCREQFYNTMLNTCAKAIRQFQEPCLLLYRALALVLCNRIQEGINELQNLKSESSVKLAVTIALMYSNKFKGVSEKEVYYKLDSQMREYRKTASSSELYNAASVLYMFKKHQKAYDYIEKSLSLEADNVEALVLKGWLQLHLFRTNQQKFTNISQIFENIMQKSPQNIDAYLGLTESNLNEKKYTDAINDINKAVVRFTGTNLPLIQKMRIQFATQEWEQAIETMNRIISIGEDALEAMQTNILILLCRDGNYDEAANCIQKFCKEIEAIEPRNSGLLIENAQLFSRACGRNINILTETYSMVEKAVQVTASNADFINELAYQCLLQSKVKEASKLYKSATKINDSSIGALLGLTLCELSQRGVTEQISHQVQFLLELEETSSPVLLFMQSKLAENKQAALNLLNEAAEKQLSVVRNQPYSAVYLKTLDPDFLLNVAKEYLQYVSQSTNFASQKVDENSVFVLNVLKEVVKACPGLQEAVFLLAKIQYINGDIHESMANLERILNSANVTCNDAYLLLAQIQVRSNLHSRAAHSLETGLSHNFNIRDNPLYHFILGLIEKDNKNHSEALKSFNTALELVNAKQKKGEHVEIALSDRASIVVELIATLMEANRLDEAAKQLQVAVEEFQGTDEEPKIMVLNADLLLAKGDVKAAVDILSQIAPSDPRYLEAKVKLANIFLSDDVDSKAYIRCYREIADSNPTADSFLLLGDAYLEILEPEKALESYSTALEMAPKDPKLMYKMGQALVATHYFQKAIDFYKENIQATDDSGLKLQLADLYIQLEDFDKAEMLLVSEVESEKNKKSEDMLSLQYKTQLLTSLSAIQEQSGNVVLALSTLKEARDNHNRIRKRLTLEGNGVPENEVQKAVDICTKLAELSISLKDNEQAIYYYKDALNVAPKDINTMAKLAQLYMQMNYLELCHQTCASLLELDPENETACILMADIAFRKVDFEMAVFHFTQLISKQPTNWPALVRFIEIMRRTGNLSDVLQYLKIAETRSSPKDAGLNYCKALYEWYSGNLNSALMNFNNARQDPEFGQEAIQNMIEICLNPNNEMLEDQFTDFVDREYNDSRTMALKTAEKLLKELRQFSTRTAKELRYRLLANFMLLATKEKLSIERALEEFLNLASQEEYKDKVGPILGIATAHTLLKQSQRAKNQLKRVAKNIWNFQDAEYLERCWLLLADYYIQSAKYDMASDLLRRVIQYNKMCVKAYELSGTIAEKEQRYKEAANFFDNAWKFSGRSNPAVGYKVAYNCMKSKKYADAIDVCHQVLKLNPDYPRIKKDVLDKSMNNLRS